MRQLLRKVVSAAVNKHFPIPFSRWIQLALGLVFLFAAGAKGFDLVRFGRLAEAIIAMAGLERTPLVAAIGLTVAVVVIILEFFLAASLLTGYKSGSASIYSMLLLIVFSGVVVWAILREETIDCGCFGNIVSRSSIETLGEDIILLIMALIGTMSKFATNRGRVAMRLIVVAGLLWSGFFYFQPPSGAALREGSQMSRGMLSGYGIETSVRYLWLFNPDCRQCQRLTPTINLIAASSPAGLTGITASSRGKTQEFQYDFATKFSITEISPEKFKSFGIQEGTLLRLESGRIDRIWTPYILNLNSQTGIAE